MALVDRLRWSWRRRLAAGSSAIIARVHSISGPRPRADSAVVPIKRLVEVATADADLIADRVGSEISMLSPAEISVVYSLVRVAAPAGARIAELGSYLGGTTCVFGEALRRGGAGRGGAGRVEVYDFFEHNRTSRRKLAAHPLFDEHDFFAIWQDNTSSYADLLEVHRGDLRQTAIEAIDPLWMLYVDVVKSDILIGPVMRSFLPRLQVGGLLVHQDYYHWQSPWVVYATERVIDHFDIVGTVSNHMMVLQLRSPIPDRMLEIDDVADLTWTEKDRLFKRAIQRYGGIRSAFLRVSRLNLMSIEGRELPDREIAALRTDFAAATRVQRYLDEVLRVHQSGERGVW